MQKINVEINESEYSFLLELLKDEITALVSDLKDKALYDKNYIERDSVGGTIISPIETNLEQLTIAFDITRNLIMANNEKR